ncbi:MAG: hypothetical protein ACRDL5_04230, partial [Solirubrobacteraceae bacterium]
NGTAGPRAAADSLPRAERLFLALCLALGEPGVRLLSQVDVDGLLTSGLLRRVAHQLAANPGEPLGGLPEDDEELARAVADLVSLAGRVPDPSADRLEHARLLLERDRLDRSLIRARVQGTGSGELARRREVVLGEIRAVGARLEGAV